MSSPIVTTHFLAHWHVGITFGIKNTKNLSNTLNTEFLNESKASRTGATIAQTSRNLHINSLDLTNITTYEEYKVQNLINSGVMFTKTVK